MNLEGFNGKANDTLLSDLPFAVANDSELTNVTSQSIYTVNPNDQWGYRIALGYDLPSCCPCYYGFSLEYTHFDEVSRNCVDAFHGIDNCTITAFGCDEFGIGFSNACAHFDTRYDTLDFLGHRHSLCSCLDLDLFLGARYINLNEDYDAEYILDDDDFDTTENIIIKNKFHGIGPYTGVGINYRFLGCFALTANAAGSLLFGDTSTSYSDTVQDVVEDTFDEFKSSHCKSHIVPGLHGKIGLALGFSLCQCGRLSIEAGYRGDKYFGVADHSALVQAIAPKDSLQKDAHYHDFEVQGPYISVALHF